MNKNFVSKPAILLDFKRDRIRIYKRTLHSLGDPEYIHMLVNPEERILAIIRSSHSDMKAYRLRNGRFLDKQSVEITSKSLLRNLLSLCSEWQDNRLYRVYGDIIPDEGIIKFKLAESYVEGGTRG